MTGFQRLWNFSNAFDHPVTVVSLAGIAIALLTASILIRVLRRTGRITDPTFTELLSRTRSWYVLATALALPILLGPGWVFGFFYLLSLCCFREYARATGLQASRTSMWGVGVATSLTYFAVLDHWMGLFTTSWVLGVYWIAILGLMPDQPRDYIRRVALGVVGFALFGVSLAHMAFLANDPLYRPILLWLLVCTGMNDVFAYLVGRSLGRRRLMPQTSPNKTWGGAVGAVVLTSGLSCGIGVFVFQGTALGHWPHLIALCLLISLLGQAGDLVVSAIKRDLGIKDMGTMIPGHGGLLDRFDSLLLVAPVVFHYLNYFQPEGVGGGQPTRIFTG